VSSSSHCWAALTRPTITAGRAVLVLYLPGMPALLQRNNAEAPHSLRTDNDTPSSASVESVGRQPPPCSARLAREKGHAVPTCLATAAHCKSVIVCAAIDVDRLSGNEASILTD
jgi:hypothetical protein